MQTDSPIGQRWEVMADALDERQRRLLAGVFSFITMNWRGRPLISHEVIVNLIASTKTRTGLTVRAELDTAQYPKGLAISDAELATVKIERNEFHGDWNYRIRSG